MRKFGYGTPYGHESQFSGITWSIPFLFLLSRLTRYHHQDLYVSKPCFESGREDILVTQGIPPAWLWHIRRKPPLKPTYDESIFEKHDGLDEDTF